MPGIKARPSGSPSTGEPAFLAAGKVRRPHGVQGEVVMELHTDFPERLRPKTKVYLGEKHHPATLRSVRIHNEGLLIGFEGIDTPEEAGRYRNQMVFVSAHSLPDLETGEYYHHQLRGLSVVNETDELLGTLTEIIETGANDVYVVTRADGKEILLPVIPDVILGINLESKTMKVHLLPGLVDGED
jgi:16S rRNA processing protein RimM